MNKLIKGISYTVSFILLCIPLCFYVYLTIELFDVSKEAYFFSFIWWFVITVALWLFYGWLESVVKDFKD